MSGKLQTALLLLFIGIFSLIAGCGEERSFHISGDVAFPPNAPDSFDLVVNVTNNGETDEADLFFLILSQGGLANGGSIINGASIGLLKKGQSFHAVERHNLNELLPGRHIMEWDLQDSAGILLDSDSKWVEF